MTSEQLLNYGLFQEITHTNLLSTGLDSDDRRANQVIRLSYRDTTLAVDIPSYYPNFMVISGGSEEACAGM